jgi:hypothetical protein
MSIDYTNEEIEAERLEALDKMPADYEQTLDELKSRYQHEIAYSEILHAAYMVTDITEGHLVDHPSVILDPEAYRFARRAHEALFDLYQRLGVLRG